MPCGSCGPYPYSCGDQTTRFRQDTAAQWVLHDPTLKSGEPGYETDTGAWKLGDGTTSWTDLAYQPAVGPIGPAGPKGEQGIPGVAGGLRIGLVTTGPVASASITGTPPDQVLNLVLPATSSGGGTQSGVFFVTQPSSIPNAILGGTVIFRAQAQSSETPITYIWKKSYDGTTWTSAGSSTDTLTYQVNSLSDNGLMFRLTASVPSGATANSLIATITIPAGSTTDPALAPPSLIFTPAGIEVSWTGGGGFVGMAGIQFMPPAFPSGSTSAGYYKTQYRTASGSWTDCDNFNVWFNPTNMAPQTSAPDPSVIGWRSGVLVSGLAHNVAVYLRIAAVSNKGRGAWSPSTNSVTPTAG